VIPSVACGLPSRVHSYTEKMQAIIYTLRDPRDGTVRYIGKAKNLADRMRSHQREAASAAKYHKARWLRTLGAAGLAPTIDPLFYVPHGMNWQDAERFFIASARAFGFSLTNGTSGGEGWHDLSPESIARMREAQRIALANPEFRARQSEMMRSKYADPAYRARAREAQRLKWAKPDVRAKLMATFHASAIVAHARPETKARRVHVNDKNIANARKFLFQGKQLSIRQISEITGLEIGTLWHRVKAGWTLEEAFGLAATNWRRRQHKEALCGR